MTRTQLERALSALSISSARLTLILAAALKLVDAGLFRESLRDWSMIPEWAALPIALSVPFVELAVGVSLVLRMHVPAMTWLLVAGLVVFTVAFLAHVWQDGATTCSCFGRLPKRLAWFDQPVFVVARNLGIALLAAPGFRRSCIT
ncbi:MAG: MauE/DoxX family redox-associated membrane protein [Phycisphaerales bacterium]